jgi:hypothetical protein
MSEISKQVGVWIDHRKAVIVSASGDDAGVQTLQSDVGSHTRYSSPSDHEGERRYEERHRQRLERYYDEVIRQLGQPEALLIFGPGEAKLELQARLSASKAFARIPVTVETADVATDAQIVARVKDHFDLSRAR